MFGFSSPWLYRWIFAVVSGALFASGHLVAGAITGVIAVLLQLAWRRWGAEHRRRSKDAIF